MSPDPRPRTVLDLPKWKAEGRRLVMLTCYDAVSVSYTHLTLPTNSRV